MRNRRRLARSPERLIQEGVDAKTRKFPKRLADVDNSAP
jgi:hypothetical protein